MVAKNGGERWQRRWHFGRKDREVGMEREKKKEENERGCVGAKALGEN